MKICNDPHIKKYLNIKHFALMTNTIVANDFDTMLKLFLGQEFLFEQNFMCHMCSSCNFQISIDSEKQYSILNTESKEMFTTNSCTILLTKIIS